MSERSRSSTPGRLRRLLFGGGESASSTNDSLALLHGRLAAIERALDDLSEVQRSSASEPPSLAAEGEQPTPPGLANIEQSLAALEKQINRAGREQLKLNVLVETQTEQQRTALEALQVANERRDNEVLALREQLRAAQQATRLDMVRALLPVLDGLAEAQRSGTHLLEQSPAPPPQRGLFRRQRQDTPSAGEQMLRESMGAWLEGLRFVRKRLLDLLAAEGVAPMEADGQRFDPHRHIVLDVVAVTDQPPGTVVSTLRQGYIAGDHVVRHAEVAVAGATTEHAASGSGENGRKQ